VDTAWFAARATAEAARALRTRLEIAPEARVVLFAGKLLPFKRPLDAVEACALLRRQGLPVEMMVAGSGLLESEMSARARTLGLPLHGLGFQNQTQMPAAYAAADMLVLPSSQETWGLVANEALACGRPVVVSDACGCAPDLAGDGSAGRVFPAGDVPALARAIESLLGEPPAAEAIRRRSERFSLDAAAEGILEAAAYAAGGRRP
jgi:glycosyltransferase involved in cell wall biosynthesis